MLEDGYKELVCVMNVGKGEDKGLLFDWKTKQSVIGNKEGEKRDRGKDGRK